MSCHALACASIRCHALPCNRSLRPCTVMSCHALSCTYYAIAHSDHDIAPMVTHRCVWALSAPVPAPRGGSTPCMPQLMQPSLNQVKSSTILQDITTPPTLMHPSLNQAKPGTILQDITTPPTLLNSIISIFHSIFRRYQGVQGRYNDIFYIIN